MSEASNTDSSIKAEMSNEPMNEPMNELIGASTQQTKVKTKVKKKKKTGRPANFTSRAPLPFDIPYEMYYAKRIPVMQMFRSALLQHYARDNSKLNSLQRGLRRFGDLLTSGHSHIAAECGVFRGSCLIACAEIIRQYGLDAHIYGLDSFEGLPEFSQIDWDMAGDVVLDTMRDRGNIFDDTSQAQVQSLLDEKALSRYATLVPGFFKDTLQTLPDGPYFFVNIDCDLYDGHLECLEFFYSKVEPGGIIFFDDYHSVHYPMARVAIDKFMHGRDESLFHIRYGPEDANSMKSFFVKH